MLVLVVVLVLELSREIVEEDLERQFPTAAGESNMGLPSQFDHEKLGD